MIFKKLNLTSFILISATTVIIFDSCRAKKPAVSEAAPVEVIQEEKSTTAPPEKEKEVEATPSPEKMPDFNYSNIQFEFNSSVLKTSSYSVLDQISTEMKKYQNVKFNINGHSSVEGTEQRNMTLSLDRANAVKAYMMNVGVDGSNLNAVGFGEAKPIADNNNEEGRILNRRVQIEKIM